MERSSTVLNARVRRQDESACCPHQCGCPRPGDRALIILGEERALVGVLCFRARLISYSKVSDSRRTRLAHMFRSSPATAALSAATSAVKRRMPSWRARSDSSASSSVPSPRPCRHRRW